LGQPCTIFVIVGAEFNQPVSIEKIEGRNREGGRGGVEKSKRTWHLISRRPAALWVYPLAAHRSYFVCARKLAYNHTSFPAGDISPNTPFEIYFTLWMQVDMLHLVDPYRLYAVLKTPSYITLWMQFIGCTVFGYIVGLMGTEMTGLSR
jgi:hypothetical protein